MQCHAFFEIGLPRFRMFRVLNSGGTQRINPIMKHHFSPTATATEREDFGTRIMGAVDELGTRSTALTQKQHRENVERAPQSLS
jgi:hypothetical protein